MVRRRSIGLIVIVGLFLCSVILRSVMSQAHAPCRFESPAVDFGEVAAGVSLSRQLPFHNVGDEEIELLRAVSSCGCVTPTIVQEKYGPGESGELQVVLDTSMIRAPQEIEQTVIVEYGRGDELARVPLKVRARVLPDVVLSKPEIRFIPSASGHQPLQLQIQRQMLTPEDFGTLRVADPGPYFKLQEVMRNSNSVRVNLQTTPLAMPNRSRLLEVQYERNGEKRVLRVPVCVEGSSESVDVQPSCFVATLPVGEAAASLAKSTERNFRLVSAENRPLVVTEVRCKRVDDQQYLGWRISENSAAEFDIWVKRAPAESQLVRTVLEVFWRDTGKGTENVRPLDVYVNVEAPPAAGPDQLAASGD